MPTPEEREMFDKFWAEHEPVPKPKLPEDLQKKLLEINSLESAKNKPWKDLTDPQKINRMREVVKELEGSVKHLSRRVHDLECWNRLMEKHEHANGRVLVDPNDNRHQIGCGEAQAAKVDGYF